MLLGISNRNTMNAVFNPFNDCASQHIGAPFFGHKLPAARARELFKPSTDSASLGVKIKKKIFRFGFELFWGERHK